MHRFSALNIIISILVLAILWVSLSGFFDLLHLSYGALSIALVMVVNYRLKKHKFFDDELTEWHTLRYIRGIYYVFWLLWQILMSGFYVAYLILSPKMPIKPYIVRFRVDLPNTQAKVILGNSITLTPGTLTVDIQGDLYTVHAIAPKSFESLENDEMPRQVKALFTSNTESVVRDFKILDSAEMNTEVQ